MSLQIALQDEDTPLQVPETTPTWRDCSVCGHGKWREEVRRVREEEEVPSVAGEEVRGVGGEEAGEEVSRKGGEGLERVKGEEVYRVEV